MNETLLDLIESPGLELPPEPGLELVERDGYTLVVNGRRASIERIRLGDVDSAVDEARALARARAARELTWWVGERSTPPALAARLEARGFEADADTPLLTALELDRRPSGAPAVEVRRVAGADDYLRALEIGWEVWDLPADERAARRADKRGAWEQVDGSGRSRHYLAFVDGEPAGFARAVFTPHAALLMGGAVLPHARGRGAYTALVHARFEDAAARGTARLAVGAGPMSAPILERLGFHALGTVRLLCDPRLRSEA